MFTIDLRKGQGLPPKSRPILVALAIVPFLIPAAVLLAALVVWQQNSMLIRTQQKVVRDNQQKISDLQNDLKQYHQTEDQIKLYSQQLGDVDKVLGSRIQTTPILVELVGTLPEFMTLAELDFNRTELRKKGTDEDKESAKSGIVIQRKMKMVISGPANDTTDMAVNHYVQNLSKSPQLSKWLNTIRIVSRNNETANNQNFSLYEIECTMKDQT